MNGIAWQKFVQQVERFIASRRFSIASVEQCMRVIDPQASCSFFCRVADFFGLFSFPSVRVFFLVPFFQKIEQKNILKTMPLQAKHAYVRLLKLLLTPEAVQYLLSTLETESVAVTVDALLASGIEFGDIVQELQEVKRRSQSNKGSRQDDEAKIEELQSIYEKRKAALKMLVAEYRQASAGACSIPALFLHDGKSALQEEWNAHIGYEKEITIPPFFANDTAFQEYVESIKKNINQIKEKRSFASFAQSVAQQLEQFIGQCKGYLEELKKIYLFRFIQECEKHLLHGDVHILSLIEEQKKALSELNTAIQTRLDVFKQEVFVIVQTLFSDIFIPYKDLPAKVESLLKQDFSGALVDQPILTRAVADVVLKNIQEHIAHRLEEIKQVATIAFQRDAAIQTINDFVAEYAQSLLCLKQYKEFREEYEQKVYEARALQLKKEEFAKMAASAIGPAIETARERYNDFFNRASAEIDTAREKCAVIERRAQLSRLRLKRRLCEIFSETLFYQDLQESLQDCRQALFVSMQQLQQLLHDGRLTASEYETACNSLAYEHDTVLLRNELAFRATRLRELRQEVIRLMLQLQQSRRLLSLLPAKDLYTSVGVLVEAVQQLLHRLENPYTLFKDILSKEAVNGVFRALWLEVEEIQAKTERMMPSVDLYLKKEAGVLKEYFFKALYDVETVVRSATGTRPQLVGHYEQECALGSDLFSSLMVCLHMLEKEYGFVQPFAFFIMIPDSRLRQKLLREARVLQENVAAITAFAKTLQQVKTFEEERIDDILELFERRGIIEEGVQQEEALIIAWDRYRKRLEEASRRVEEEVIFDIGFIDQKALMDIDDAHTERLTEILKIGAIQAYKKATDAETGILDRLAVLGAYEAYSEQSTHPLCKKLYDTVCDSCTAWLQRQFPETATHFYWKRELEDACELFFLVKCMEEMQKNNTLAAGCVLVEEAHLLVSLVHEWLVQTRKMKYPLLQKPWIEETCSLHLVIDQRTFDEEALEQLMAQITALAEIAHRTEEEKKSLPLEQCYQELVHHMRMNREGAIASQPFFYLPGCLSYN